MCKTTQVVLGALLLASPICASPQQQQQSSAAEAARKAREQKKTAPKASKVFTNDNLASAGGGVSVVGTVAPPEKPQEEAKGTPTAAKEKGEAYWRARFAEARSKLSQAEKELDILQRELNLLQVQYYSDPNKALRQQFDRSEINNHRKKIADKQAEVQQLRQALSDLEDQLRQAGGPPAWVREP